MDIIDKIFLAVIALLYCYQIYVLISIKNLIKPPQVTEKDIIKQVLSRNI